VVALGLSGSGSGGGGVKEKRRGISGVELVLS